MLESNARALDFAAPVVLHGDGERNHNGDLGILCRGETGAELYAVEVHSPARRLLLVMDRKVRTASSTAVTTQASPQTVAVAVTTKFTSGE